MRNCNKKMLTFAIVRGWSCNVVIGRHRRCPLSGRSGRGSRSDSGCGRASGAGNRRTCVSSIVDISCDKQKAQDMVYIPQTFLLKINSQE